MKDKHGKQLQVNKCVNNTTCFSPTLFKKLSVLMYIKLVYQFGSPPSSIQNPMMWLELLISAWK